MKRIASGSIWAVWAVTAALCQDVYVQDFQQDPGWQSTRPDLVYWDAAAEAFYTRVQDDGTQYYGISPAFPVVENTSFVIEFDVNPVVVGWGTYPDLIFKHETEGLHRTREDRSNQASWDLVFEVHWDDFYVRKFMLTLTEDGSYHSLSHSPTFQVGTWYHQKVVYDKDTETLTWTITQRADGTLFHEAEYGGCRIGAFSQVAAGHQGVAPYYGYGRWCTTLFDNLRVAKTAPTEADVAAAVLAMSDRISLLDPAVFRHKHAAATLIRKLEAVIAAVTAGLLEEARDKLTQDIGAKMDGCASQGSPDANDWLVDCAAQAELRARLDEAVALLDALL